MPFRSVAVILNPAAGNRRAGRARAQLREALEASGVPFEIIATERPNHAATLARRAATQFDAVIAGGGDGTVQEVATGLLGNAHATPFGVLPLGTGNDFAHQLGVPKRPSDAVRALLAADVVPVDAGIVRWRDAGDVHHIHEAVFVNAVGIGFDALVAAEAAQFKVFRGISGYVMAVAKALRIWQQPDVEVRRREPVAAGEPQPTAEPPMYAGPFFLAAVSNGTSVGGGFRLTPDARIDDGLLDLCLVSGPLSLARISRLLPKAIAGRHLHEPEVRMDRLEALTLRLSAGVPIHVDGEVLTRSAVEVEVEVQPAAFRMLRVGPRI
ncbi:MAG: diacylglycerol kinase family protein [Rhodothermales bacterium]